jgi:hypothetical protein
MRAKRSFEYGNRELVVRVFADPGEPTKRGSTELG